MVIDCNLDICRLNGRKYVQAVQMLSHAAQRLEGVRTLTRAKFTDFTDRQIMMLVGSEHEPLGKIGEAVFETETGEEILASFIELSEAAPEKTGSEPVLVSRCEAPHEFTVASAAGFEQLLVCMLQSVMLLVKDRYPDMASPRLTAFRRSHIPCLDTDFPAEMRILVKPVRDVEGRGILHRTDALSFSDPDDNVFATANMFSAYCAGAEG